MIIYVLLLYINEERWKSVF